MLFAGAAIGGLILGTGPSVPVGATLRTAPTNVASPEAATDPIDGPLGALDSGIRDAVRLYRGKDEMAVTIASRDRAARFRDKPGTGMLDRCAAFDDAVVGLQDRDPLRDAGFFAPLAVTGRQWSAAS